MSITLKQIEACPWNTRGEITRESVSDLVRSIRTTGLISPITIWRGDDGVVYCIAGNRRLEALKVIGDEIEPEQYVVFVGSEESARMVTVVENLQREDVSPIQEAELIATCLDGGLPAETIAANCGRSVSWVNRRRKLIGIGDEWKTREGLTTDTLERIAVYPIEIQRKVAKITARNYTRWCDLKNFFDNESRNLESARFDKTDCAACVKRTGVEQDLFGDVDGGLGRCLDCACYKAKDKERVTALVARATKGAKETVDVVYSYGMPSYCEDKKSAKNCCAYYYAQGDDIIVKWGEPKSVIDARKAEEREAREAEAAKEIAKCNRTREIMDKLSTYWGDWSEDGKRSLVTRAIFEADDATRDMIVDIFCDWLDGWHSQAEWASFVSAFEALADAAGVSEDDRKFLISSVEEDNDGE